MKIYAYMCKRLSFLQCICCVIVFYINYWLVLYGIKFFLDINPQINFGIFAQTFKSFPRIYCTIVSVV